VRRKDNNIKGKNREKVSDVFSSNRIDSSQNWKARNTSFKSNARFDQDLQLRRETKQVTKHHKREFDDSWRMLGGSNTKPNTD